MEDTHNKRVLEYIYTNGSITAKEAFLKLGCLRLSARVHDLRAAGHNITTTMVNEVIEKHTTEGRKRRIARNYARYSM